jgi:hypothetical protein
MILAAAGGALLLALVSAGGAQAETAPSAQAPTLAATCTIKSYSPNKVAVGGATVKTTFALKTTGCTADDWDISVFPYNSDLDKGLSSTSAHAISFSPKTFENSDAGKHINGALVAVYSTVESGAGGPQLNTDFTLLRRATWGSTLNASPEPVKKGKKVTIKATLTRINWTWKTAKKMPYAGYTSRAVVLQFKATGTSTYKNIKTVKTGTGGKVSTTATASKSGTWRFTFAGTSTTGSATSTGDKVTVK